MSVGHLGIKKLNPRPCNYPMPSTISTAPGAWRAGSSKDASDVSGASLGGLGIEFCVQGFRVGGSKLSRASGPGGLAFGVALGFRVKGLGFRVVSNESTVWFSIWGSGFRSWN